MSLHTHTTHNTQHTTSLTAFNLASGCKTNPKKVYLLSSRSVSKEEITAIFYSPWDCIKPVSSIKYLGILVGYEITPADVFAEAIEKLENHVAKYMPKIG